MKIENGVVVRDSGSVTAGSASKAHKAHKDVGSEGKVKTSSSAPKPTESEASLVAASLQRIREKASAPSAPISSPKAQTDNPAKPSGKLLFVLPPKEAPKAFSTKSAPKKTVSSTAGPLPRRVLESEDDSEQFIDADTGKLTLYKRKITSESVDSYVIPLKKKRVPLDASGLTEPILPPPRRSPTPSPEHSAGEGYDEDEQYNFPINEPDAQPDSYDDTGDQGTQNVGQDPQLFNARASPTEDSAGFHALLERAAANHDVDMHADPIEEDFLFDTFSVSERTVKTLPMLKGVLKHAGDIFKEPTRARVVNPRIEKKYRPAPADPAYIRGQLPLDSLVVANARKRANSQTTGEAPPPDKESKVLEAGGKRVAAQAANFWRIANTQALLARYDRAHYDTLEQVIQHLPPKFQEGTKLLIEEGKLISNAAPSSVHLTPQTQLLELSTLALC
ncbi:uncharacterized protein LOC144756483 [Lissotriton helveticus]